jgi:hypothetical protein
LAQRQAHRALGEPAQLVWLDLVWLGLAWFGLVRLGSAWFGFALI